MSKTPSVVMFAVLGLTVLLGVSAPVLATHDRTEADRVFGQFSFSCNQGLPLPSASILCFPSGAALDLAGNLYVADRGNHRVLVYLDPLNSDNVADRVFGQVNSFTIGTCNNGGLSARSLCSPSGVAVDEAGNLYIADSQNHRVLVYLSPLTTDDIADLVFGHPDFNTSGCNGGNSSLVNASTLCFPTTVSVDLVGNVYVADDLNNRVLEYDTPLQTTDVMADRVFGQFGFTTRGCPSAPNAGNLCSPFGVAVDAAGSHLYVTDNVYHRMLEYDEPLTSDATADRVFGPPDFFTRGDQSFFNPLGPAVDASGNVYVPLPGSVVEFDSPVTTDNLADLTIRGFGFSQGTAVDAAGNLYVADANRQVVWEFDTPLIPPDQDGDGLEDGHDACPTEPPRFGLDANNNGCTDTLVELRAIVQGVSLFPESAKSGLLAKLDDAQKALDRGNIQVAVNKLRDFIDQVESMVRSRTISPADGEGLINWANNVITLIST